MKRTWTCIIIFLNVVFFILPAHADDSGISGTQLYLFYAPPGKSPFLGQPTTEILGSGEFYFSFTNSFRTQQIFKLQTTAGNTVSVVKHLLTSDTVLAFSPFKRINLAVNYPFHVLSVGQNTITQSTYNTTDAGDMRFSLVYNLIKEDLKKERPGVNIHLFNTIPTGNDRKFLGWQSPVMGFSFIFSFTKEPFTTSFSLGARFPEETVIQGNTFDDHLTFGLGLGWQTPWHDLTLTGEIAGQIQVNNFSTITSPIEVTLGLSKETKSRISLGIGVGAAVTDAIGNSNFKALFKLGYQAKRRSIHSTISEQE